MVDEQGEMEVKVSSRTVGCAESGVWCQRKLDRSNFFQIRESITQAVVI